MQEDKWWQGWTWVGWLNFILLQWFFVRLGYMGWTKGNKHLIWGVIPLTGWWSDFRFIDGREGKK